MFLSNLVISLLQQFNNTHKIKIMKTIITNNNVTIETANELFTFTPECLVIIQEFNGETSILMDTDGTCYNVKGNNSSKAFDRLVLDGEYLRKETLPVLTEEFINDYDFSFLS